MGVLRVYVQDANQILYGDNVRIILKNHTGVAQIMMGDVGMKKEITIVNGVIVQQKLRFIPQKMHALENRLSKIYEKY